MRHHWARTYRRGGKHDKGTSHGSTNIRFVVVEILWAGDLVRTTVHICKEIL